MATYDEVDARLGRLEARLDRMTELLERALAREPRTNGVSARALRAPDALDHAKARANDALATAFPPGEVEEKLAELLVRLGDPETLETLGRVAVLLPQIEYALQAVAAGPELLEEGLDLLGANLEARGTGPAEMKRRLAIAADVVTTLSRPEVLRALGQLAGASVAVDPLVRGVADAGCQLAAAEGGDALAGRVRDALIELAEEGTLGALTRIATLAPDLEYAVNALAAGPALLEEGLELAKHRLAASGLTTSDVDRRLDGAFHAVLALTETKSTAALADLGKLLPLLSPLTLALGDASRDLAAVEGSDALRARLGEAVIRLAEPEVLSSLVRVATLAPDLEYAVNALAAGPELLEEGLELARHRLAQSGLTTSDVERRVDGAFRAVVALTDAKSTAALADLGALLPALSPLALALGDAGRDLAAVEGSDALRARLAESVVRLAEPEVLSSLVRVATLAPDLEYAVNALAAGPALLEEGMEMVTTWSKANLGEGAPIEARLRAALEVLATLSEPKTLSTLVNLVHSVPKLAPKLEELTRVAEKLDPKALGELAELTAKPANLAALKSLIELAPSLVKRVDTNALFGLAEATAKPQNLAALKELLELAPTLVKRLDTAALLDLAEITAKPTNLAALKELLELAPTLQRTLAALPVQAGTLHVLESVNAAVERASERSEPVSMWGILGALRDPEVQKAAGFGIEIARLLGRDLYVPSNGKKKALPPKGD